MQFVRVDQAVEMIRKEFERTPTLAVTFWQAQRLWNLSGDLCERALRDLIREHFLIPAPDGTYVRRGESPTPVQQIEAMLRAM